jgi:hypothetical protein
MIKLKVLFCIMLTTLFLAGCGNVEIDAEAVGQVKKVTNATPVLCLDYQAVDISMGVMRNGVGSMSTQDIWFYIPDIPGKNLAKTLRSAAESGKLVKVTYDVRRWAPCSEDHWITSVEVLN